MGTLKCRVLQLETALAAVTQNYYQLKRDYASLKEVKDSLMVKLESAQEEVQELRRLLSEATGIYPVD